MIIGYKLSTLKNKKLDWNEERKFYLVMAAVGAVIAVVFYFIPKDARKIEETHLAVVEGLKLERDPEIERGRYGEKIRFKFVGIEKLFQISGSDFSPRIKKNILRQLHAGDTLSVGMDSSEFRYMHKDRFLDEFVEIHSLQKNEVEYMELKRTNRILRSDLELGVPLGLCLLILGLIYWNLNERPMYSPTLVISIVLLFILFFVRNAK